MTCILRHITSAIDKTAVTLCNEKKYVSPGGIRNSSFRWAKDLYSAVPGLIGMLDQEKTLSLLTKYQIPFSASVLCQNKIEALQKASSVGFPLVLKVQSPDIIHKTDVGGIRTGISSQSELTEALTTMEAAIRKSMPKAKFGFMLQKQETGKEVIIGMKRDEQFGPVILFGMGGILVELYKDVSMRIAPLEEQDIKSMMAEIKGNRILEGYRGEKAVNMSALADILTKISNLSIGEENIKEIDFNPVIVNAEYAKVIDARMI
jgi:acyl-CoA synthetase (NDP forming)